MYDLPLHDDQGKFLTEVVLVQDFFAWASQGAVAERDKEHLGQSDIGVIMYRELLGEQIARVERGEEPMGVVRDPARNVQIDLPDEKHMFDARQLIGGTNRSAPELYGLPVSGSARCWTRCETSTPRRRNTSSAGSRC